MSLLVFRLKSKTIHYSLARSLLLSQPTFLNINKYISQNRNCYKTPNIKLKNERLLFGNGLLGK